MAFHEFSIECADARSAFLQAERTEEARRIWVHGLPEVEKALGLKPGGLARLLGALYGLTNAPRIFWRDSDKKFKELNLAPLQVDPCVWILMDEGRLVGGVGSHVDDFMLGGSMDNPKSHQVTPALVLKHQHCVLNHQVKMKA